MLLLGLILTLDISLPLRGLALGLGLGLDGCLGESDALAFILRDRRVGDPDDERHGDPTLPKLVAGTLGMGGEFSV